MPDPTLTPEMRQLLANVLGSGKKPYNMRHDNPSAMPPYPPSPPMFQKDPPVLGSPQIARMVKMILDIDPYVKQRVSKVSTGPDVADVVGRLGGSNFAPHQFDQTTLAGRYGVDTGQMFINPGPPRNQFDPKEILSTIAHETTHGAGFGEGTADTVSDAVLGLPKALELLRNAFKR